MGYILKQSWIQNNVVKHTLDCKCSLKNAIHILILNIWISDICSVVGTTFLTLDNQFKKKGHFSLHWTHKSTLNILIEQIEKHGWGENKNWPCCLSLRYISYLYHRHSLHTYIFSVKTHIHLLKVLHNLQWICLCTRTKNNKPHIFFHFFWQVWENVVDWTHEQFLRKLSTMA